MEKDDVELIHSILSGDESAFSDLVHKYQKTVHALAWRKVEDFQAAEEIAQDAFLQAYKRLATLKSPNQFAGWLYVITSNLCHDWHRRKKPTMQSLDATNARTLEKTAYERFLAQERERVATEHRRELVKNLLDKLPESERTVVTLHYLGEMTSEAISKFLGVSVNTIKSRLRRARKRLQKEEQMIRETLGSVQLPNNFTENIMQQVRHIKPSAASNSKPLLPWAALGSAAVLVILLLGVSNQLFTLFQKPYSLEAQSEPTIEIVDSPIVLDIQSTPEIRKRITHAAVNSNNGSSQQKSFAALAENEQGDSSKTSLLTHNWTPAKSPGEGNVNEIFLTDDGKLYAVSPTGIYRTTEDESGWVLLNRTVPSETHFKMPMAEQNGVLYLVTSDEIFASTDSGVTWTSIGSKPLGTEIELLITEEAFYLVLEDEIYISTDVGKSWIPFNDGIQNREITTAAAIDNTIFVGTDRGVYRLNADRWEQLSVGTFRKIISLAVTDNTVYVVTSPDKTDLTPEELKTKLIREIMRKENSNRYQIYRSDDLGDSWIKVTPTQRHFTELIPYISLNIGVIAVNETLIAFGLINTYRSRDKGETWKELGPNNLDSSISLDSSVVAANENTLYKESFYRLQRSKDGGESWQPFMKGIIGNQINALVAFKDRLYAHSGFEIVQSADGGGTWTNVNDTSQNISFFLYPTIDIEDDMLYAVARDVENRWRVCSLSPTGDLLTPVEGLPPISGYGSTKFFDGNNDNTQEPNNTNTLTEDEVLTDQVRSIQAMLNVVNIGGMTVTGKTYYTVRDGRLYRSHVGCPDWIDTGLETGEDFSFNRGKLAASGETVYVAKADGQLFQSIDSGKNWKNITNDLPITFREIRDITFVGSSVYIATDEGVISVQTGEQWRVLTDTTDTVIDITCITIESGTVYGIGRSGIYKLNDQGEWELFIAEVPDQVSNLIIHDERFYIATDNQGIFHIPIQKQNR